MSEELLDLTPSVQIDLAQRVEQGKEDGGIVSVWPLLSTGCAQ